MRVLLVEDDAPIRKAVLAVLVDEGYEVVAAETGEQALERCREEPLDVLFTDVRLPGDVDGWDVAETFREENPHLPVIYATGGFHSRSRMVPGGILFQKPYQPEEIICAIRRLTS
jgi:CheY-like chemotaxis protein